MSIRTVWILAVSPEQVDAVKALLRTGLSVVWLANGIPATHDTELGARNALRAAQGTSVLTGEIQEYAQDLTVWEADVRYDTPVITEADRADPLRALADTIEQISELSGVGEERTGARSARRVELMARRGALLRFLVTERYSRYQINEVAGSSWESRYSDALSETRGRPQ